VVPGPKVASQPADELDARLVARRRRLTAVGILAFEAVAIVLGIVVIWRDRGSVPRAGGRFVAVIRGGRRGPAAAGTFRDPAFPCSG
jgi:hypothetical protein